MVIPRELDHMMPVDYGKAMKAGMWWMALPEITKIAIYDDLKDISEEPT